mmetsp:Transcript_22719/g.57884  ORF Transcript_22719/g.57884 Transcript_22719/m.57884 type:complete len:221 (-) Transcript_22719:96-758(-)
MKRGAGTPRKATCLRPLPSTATVTSLLFMSTPNTATSPSFNLTGLNEGSEWLCFSPLDDTPKKSSPTPPSLCSAERSVHTPTHTPCLDITSIRIRKVCTPFRIPFPPCTRYHLPPLPCIGVGEVEEDEREGDEDDMEGGGVTRDMSNSAQSAILPCPAIVMVGSHTAHLSFSSTIVLLVYLSSPLSSSSASPNATKRYASAISSRLNMGRRSATFRISST